jgi:hypothetical protein
LKFYRLESEAYFSLSEIFVNGRCHAKEARPYPVERASIGRPENPVGKIRHAVFEVTLWKS